MATWPILDGALPNTGIVGTSGRGACKRFNTQGDDLHVKLDAHKAFDRASKATPPTAETPTAEEPSFSGLWQ